MATQDDEDDEWRFSLDDLDDGEVGETATDASGDGDGNIAGTLETRQPLEPGDIDLENAVFVALGVLIVVGLILGAVLGF
jgi:hypothetical protein